MNREKQPRLAAPGSFDGRGSETATIKAVRAAEGNAAGTKEKHPRGYARKKLLTVCTGILVLAFSAIPALALWLGDVQLLAQPHERTRQAGALALTSDDLYLTRILKKNGQRNTANDYYWQSDYYSLTNPDNMNWCSTRDVLDLLDTVYEAGLLPEELWSYCSGHIEQAFTSSDRLGFLYYIAYDSDAVSDNAEYRYTVGLMVESESQKMVSVCVCVPMGYAPPALQAQTILQAYRDHLELGIFENWEDPADTWFAGRALYSPQAEVMLSCEIGSYQAQGFRGYPVSLSEPTENYDSRFYYCLNASSFPEETVRSWQEYARSFPAGTDVWHWSGGADGAGVALVTGEEPLG